MKDGRIERVRERLRVVDVGGKEKKRTSKERGRRNQ
jgi:hypothetical protein